MQVGWRVPSAFHRMASQMEHQLIIIWALLVWLGQDAARKLMCGLNAQAFSRRCNADTRPTRSGQNGADDDVWFDSHDDDNENI